MRCLRLVSGCPQANRHLPRWRTGSRASPTNLLYFLSFILQVLQQEKGAGERRREETEASRAKRAAAGGVYGGLAHDGASTAKRRCAPGGSVGKIRTEMASYVRSCAMAD